jgi:hypothetical protein
MESICPRIQCTSPLWGEVDLRSKSGEGPRLQRATVTPHPRLRRDLSRWERWIFDAVAVQPELVML